MVLTDFAVSGAQLSVSHAPKLAPFALTGFSVPSAYPAPQRSYGPSQTAAERQKTQYHITLATGFW